MTVQVGSDSRVESAASRAWVGIVPSMRVWAKPLEARAVPMMERKEVHWEKMTVFVVGSFLRAAVRMVSKASTLEELRSESKSSGGALVLVVDSPSS